MEKQNKGRQAPERSFTVTTGLPLPLGVTITPEGVNFSIFSSKATSVTLGLFTNGQRDPFTEIRLDPHYNRTGDVWHALLAGLGHEGVLYAYKMEGEYDPAKGERFDPDVWLLDPYTRSVAGAERWASDYIKVNYERRTKTGSGLRSRISYDRFDWRGDRPPGIPMNDLVIYELHTRGFTRHPSSGVDNPGTFAGLIEKLPHLKKLGINAIELMPVHEFFESEIERSNPVTGERLINYWGYSTISFFAPKASYAAAGKDGGQVNEFKELVRRCHEEGIEVILDVVFNHTAEGDPRGPTISFRGLDNNTYYMLGPGGEYFNFSGCGNTLNCNHPVVRDMIRECLRYWVMETHVDGFRFDLASILGRDSDGVPLSSPPLIEAIALDPVLAHCKLIAEAWDAAGLYQIGSFCEWGRWGEWNGQYRDTARKFLRGDDYQAPELARRISGSPDLYEDGGRYPYHSINFITCHDGFTLADLFSYDEKHNEQNGENNNDGSNDNWSHNNGAEGDTADENINAVRRRQMKNAVVLLMLSQGVPMLYEGDEMGRSKQGNNNTYCHDNELNWVDWSTLEKNSGLFRFTAEVIAFRKRHSTLRRETYYTGGMIPGSTVRDVEWYGADGEEKDWSAPSARLAFVIGGLNIEEGGREPDIFAAFNGGDDQHDFTVPPPADGRAWRLKIFTANESPGDFFEDGAEAELENKHVVTLPQKSCAVLVSVAHQVARPLRAATQ